MSSVYAVNKGVNRPIEFKGLKAQYIWWLGGGLVLLLLLFSILYLCGLNMYLCLVIIILLTVALFIKVYSMSERYGEHGLLKLGAKKALPDYIICRSKKIFPCLN